MYIGYNVEKINEMMDTLKNAGLDVAKFIAEDFEQVRAKLRENWVGYDELDFENRLIDRLNELTDSTKEFTLNGIKNMYNLGCAWVDFQNNNVIEGTLTNSLKNKLNNPPESLTFEHVMKSAKTFSGSENMGLTSSASPSIMSRELGAFVGRIKSQAMYFFMEAESCNAFFGTEQKKAVQLYVDKMSTSLAVIETSIKDFDEAMSKLAGSAYTTADQDVSNELAGSMSKVDESLAALGDSRWSA